MRKEKEREMQIDSLNLLQGNFIVATPLLKDPFLQKSVVFITEFKDNAAYGFLTNYQLQDLGLLDDVKDLIQGSIFENSSILLGGPMDHTKYFMIHSADVFCSKSLKISNKVCVTNLKDAIEHFDQVPNFYHITMGYCSWHCGELDQEVKNGFWLLKPFEYDILFLKSDNTWKTCIKSFNFNVKKFSSNNGYA